MTHAQQLESILFVHGEPMTTAELCRMLKIDKDQLAGTVQELSNSLQDRGIVLVQNNETITLATHPECSALIDLYRKEELSTELSKASLETLAIILYRDNVSRGEIDFIRGVNSQFILRNLTLRGLIERAPDPTDSRRSVYRPTVDTLRYLGVTSVKELPDFDMYIERLSQVMKGQESVTTEA